MDELPKKKSGRIFKLVLIAVGSLVVVVLALVALAPTLISAGFGKSIIENQIASAVRGSASVQSLSLSWFGSQSVQGLSIQDSKKQRDIRLDVGVGNGLYDLLTGRVGELRLQLSGSVQAQMESDGSTSLNNLAPPASPTSPATLAPQPATQKSGAIDLPFPIRLSIATFDATLLDAKGTVFAVRGLKGSASAGRGQPLVVDLSATTQVHDRAGNLAIKGSLDHFLSQQGDVDLTAVTGEMQAQVSGWLLAALGLNAEVQSAALQVRAPAGQPIDITVNAKMLIDAGATQMQAQMQAARPAAGRALAAWATDPRTWVGNASVEGLPTQSLQSFVATTPLLLARDLGLTISCSLQTGQGSEFNLNVDSQQVKLSALATIDIATGAMQGKGITLQATLDPALLAALGTTVDAPVQISANIASLRTPAIIAGASFDTAAIACDGSITVQPFNVLGLAAEPVAVGAFSLNAKAAPIGNQIDCSLRGALQQAPIEVIASIKNLGAKLSKEQAQLQATFAAGPLDAGVIPGLPPAAREWIARVKPGMSTLRASVGGGWQQGAAQAQVDMGPGSIALKSSWDANTLSVQQVQSALTLQPALIAFLTNDQLRVTAPIVANLRAGPLQCERKAIENGSFVLPVIPCQLQVPTISISAAPGLVGNTGVQASVQDVQLRGMVAPSGPMLFDGSIAIASLNADDVESAGAVQLQTLSVQAKVPLDFTSAATLQVTVASVSARNVPSVGAVQLQTLAVQANAPLTLAGDATVQATIASIDCPKVPGFSSAIGARGVKASLQGPLTFGAGTNASFSATLHDATAAIASVQATYAPEDKGWKSSVQSSDVDMRRVLSLVGQAADLPEWIGNGANRSLSAVIAGGPGGISFGVNAALDPISMQVQGSRATSGSITISKGVLKAKLPASVVLALVNDANKAVQAVSCDPLQISATLNACTLIADASGALDPCAVGSDVNLTARLEPWKIQPKGAPILAFGANDLAITMKAGIGASATLAGSLAAEGMPASPLKVSLQTAHVIDQQRHLAFGTGSVSAAITVTGFPTAMADRLAGMNGYLLDMLGPVFTVNITGKSGKNAEDFFKGTFTSPMLTVHIPRVRLSDGVVSVAPDAPITASLRPDDNFRRRILRPVNPLLADIRTLNDRPIEATVSAARITIPMDMKELDASFSVNVGEVEMEKSSQFIGLLDIASQSQSKTIPGLVSPLNGSIAQGILTYRDFKVQVGKLGPNAWQQTLFSDARINLVAVPAVADPITIRYPLSSIANFLGGIAPMRSVLSTINKALGSANGSIQQAVQVKVQFTGPLDGSPLKIAVSPEVDLPKGMGGNIQNNIGKALGDLFGTKK